MDIYFNWRYFIFLYLFLKYCKHNSPPEYITRYPLPEIRTSITPCSGYCSCNLLSQVSASIFLIKMYLHTAIIITH